MAEPSARSRIGLATQVAVLGALTFGSLAWAGWGMDVRATLTAASGFDLRWALPMTLCLFGTLFLRVLRFRLLLDHPVDNRAMLGVTAIGFLAINVVPLRMGEFVRPFLLAERHGSPFGLALAALFMERLLDLSALMVLLAIIGGFVELPPAGMHIGDLDLLVAGQRAAGAAVSGGLVGIVVLAIAGPPGVAMVSRLAGRVSPSLGGLVERLGGRFVQGFRALGARPAKAVAAVAMTAALWGTTVGVVACGLAGMPGMRADATAAGTTWAATMTAMALVPTPGFVGSFEAGAVAGMTVVGIAADPARAFAVLLHGAMLGFTVVCGIIALLAEGVSLAQVVRDSRANAA